MTDTEIKELFEANGQFATGKDYALIRVFETIIRQQHTWVGLTDDEVDLVVSVSCKKDSSHLDAARVAREVEAKLKAKNERLEKNT